MQGKRRKVRSKKMRADDIKEWTGMNFASSARMDDFRFYVLFISGRWVDDNEWMCAMESHLRLRGFLLERDSNSGPLDQ